MLLREFQNLPLYVDPGIYYDLLNIVMVNVLVPHVAQHAQSLHCLTQS